MKMPVYSVNARGLREIDEFLREHYKGGREFSREQLLAWAEEAESQCREGNPASIELKGWQSVSGATTEYTISDEGLDVEMVEIDE